MGSRVPMELIFEILTDGDIVWRASNAGSAKTIQYSRNGRSWETITSTTEGVVIPVRAGEIIGWQGHNSGYATSTENFSSWGGSTATFNVRGNIMALVDETQFESETAITEDYAFANLFGGTGVVDASGLRLIATTLTDYCYYGLFGGCSALTAAPTFPAMTLKPSCYRAMFVGCTSLTTMPSLPATAAADYCYDWMFAYSGLTSIVAPAATTLAEYCYNGMFLGCSGITTVPALPATTAVRACYMMMFSNCSSLTTATNALSNMTTLADGCFNNMFEACTSLVNPPTLPALSIAQSSYTGMFKGCTSLVNAPALPATTLSNYCYHAMFENCTSLRTAPDLLIHAATTPTGLQCYAEMFKGCSSLNYIKCLMIPLSGETFFTDWVDGVSASGTFVKAADAADWPTGISGIPSGWTVTNA